MGGNMGGNTSYTNFMGNNNNKNNNQTGFFGSSSTTSNYANNNNQNTFFSKTTGKHTPGLSYMNQGNNQQNTNSNLGVRVGGNTFLGMQNGQSATSSMFFGSRNNNQAGGTGNTNFFGNQSGVNSSQFFKNKQGGNNKSFFGGFASNQGATGGNSNLGFMGNKNSSWLNNQNQQGQNTNKSFFSGNANTGQNSFFNTGQGQNNKNAMFAQNQNNSNNFNLGNTMFGKQNQTNSFFGGSNKTAFQQNQGGKFQPNATSFFGGAYNNNNNSNTGFQSGGQNNNMGGFGNNFFNANQNQNQIGSASPNSFFGGRGNNLQMGNTANSNSNFNMGMYGQSNQNQNSNGASFNTQGLGLNNPRMAHQIQQAISMSMINNSQKQLLPLLTSFYQGLKMNINAQELDNFHAQEPDQRKLEQIETLIKDLQKGSSTGQIGHVDRGYGLSAAERERLAVEKVLGNMKLENRENLTNEIERAAREVDLANFRSETLDALKVNEIIIKPNPKHDSYRPCKTNADYARVLREMRQVRTNNAYSFDAQASKSSQNKNPNVATRQNSKTARRINTDLIELRVTVNYTNETIVLEKFKVNINCSVFLFKRGVVQNIDLFGRAVSTVARESTITFSGVSYSNETKLNAIREIRELDIIIGIKIKFQTPPLKKETQAHISNLCPVDKLPISTRRDYILKPSLLQMAQMTLQEVQNVKDFSVQNNFGKIKWPGNSNLVGLDLDVLIEISIHKSEVYPEDLYPKEELKPARGTALNKRAIITLYNVPITDTQPEEFNQKLEEMAKTQDCQHVEYDEHSEKWTIQVEHFTVYSFLEGEDTTPKRQRENTAERQAQDDWRRQIPMQGAEGEFREEDSFSGPIERGRGQRQMGSETRFHRSREQNFRSHRGPNQPNQARNHQNNHNFEHPEHHSQRANQQNPDSRSNFIMPKTDGKSNKELEALSENVFKTEELTESQKIYARHQNAQQILQLFQIKTQTNNKQALPQINNDPKLKQDLETIRSLFTDKILSRRQKYNSSSGLLSNTAIDKSLYITRNLLSTGSAMAFNPVTHSLAIYFKDAAKPDQNLQIISKSASIASPASLKTANLLKSLRKAFVTTIQTVNSETAFDKRGFMRHSANIMNLNNQEGLSELFKVAAGEDLATMEELLANWNMRIGELIKVRKPLAESRIKKRKMRKGSRYSEKSSDFEVEQDSNGIFELRQVQLAVQMLLVLFGGSESLEAGFGARVEYLTMDTEKNEVLEDYFFQRKLLLWLESFRKSLFVNSEILLEDEFKDMNLESVSCNGSFTKHINRSSLSNPNPQNPEIIPRIPNSITLHSQTYSQKPKSIHKDLFLKQSKSILKLEYLLNQKSAKVDTSKMIKEFATEHKENKSFWVLVPRLFLNSLTLWNSLISKSPSNVSLFDGCGFSKEVSVCLEFVATRLLVCKIDPVLLKGKVSKSEMNNIFNENEIQEEGIEKNKNLANLVKEDPKIGQTNKKIEGFGINFGAQDENKFAFGSKNQDKNKGIFNQTEETPESKPALFKNNFEPTEKDKQNKLKFTSSSLFGSNNKSLFNQNTKSEPVKTESKMNSFMSAIGGTKPPNTLFGNTTNSVFGIPKADPIKTIRPERQKEKKVSSGLFGSSNLNTTSNFGMGGSTKNNFMTGQSKPATGTMFGGFNSDNNASNMGLFNKTKPSGSTGLFGQKDKKPTGGLTGMGLNLFSNTPNTQVPKQKANNTTNLTFGIAPAKKTSTLFGSQISTPILNQPNLQNQQNQQNQQTQQTQQTQQSQPNQPNQPNPRTPQNLTQPHHFQDNKSRLDFLNRRVLISALEICLEHHKYLAALSFVTFSGVDLKSRLAFGNLVFDALNMSQIASNKPQTLEPESFQQLIRFFNNSLPKRGRLVNYKVDRRVKDLIIAYLQIKMNALAETTFYFSMVFKFFQKSPLQLDTLDELQKMADIVLKRSDSNQDNAFLVYVAETIHLMRELTGSMVKNLPKIEEHFERFFKRMTAAFYDPKAESASFKELLLLMNAGVLQSVSEFRGGKCGIWDSFKKYFAKCYLGLPLKNEMMPVALALLTNSQRNNQ